MADKQEQEITAEITAEQLGYFAHMRDSEGETGVATIYRRAARTIGRLEKDREHCAIARTTDIRRMERSVSGHKNRIAHLEGRIEEMKPHAEIGRLIERLIEMSQWTPYLIYYDAEGNMRRVALDAPALRQLVAVLKAARQQEPAPAPSGAVYEVHDGVLMAVLGGGQGLRHEIRVNIVPTVDLDHVHALMHGRQG